MAERVLFQDVFPYDVPASLSDLAGPRVGVLVLPHSIHWGPDRAVDLDSDAGRSKAYRAIVREGTRAQQEALLNADVLRELWNDLRLPARCRAVWEARFPKLAPPAPGGR